MALIFNLVFSQVGINTNNPNAKSALDVVSKGNNSGVLIPRLTTAQRNAINTTSAEDGLTIYNVDDKCFNYWQGASQEWNSVCGALGKATFTFNCSAVTVNGNYVQGKELTASNYLNIPVSVTKAGSYTITATSGNGYNFSTTGVFLDAGSYTVQVQGQGTPTAVKTDNISIKANDKDITCTPAVQVTVLSPSGTYTMGCNGAVQNGIYKLGVPLTATNTVTLPVDVTVLGSYSVKTDVVDGISFSASGVFTGTGPQNITLYGTGTPTSTTTKTMTITSNSQGAVSTKCSFSLTPVMTAKKILFLGDNTYGRGGSAGTTANVINSKSNFGTNSNSIVKIEAITTYPPLNTTGVSNATNLYPRGAALQTAIDTEKPDVIIISYYYLPTAADAQVIATYLNKGGVVLDMEQDANAVNIPKVLFSESTIALTDRGASVYRFTNTSDPILNGPFGDIRSLLWSSDAAGTAVLNNLPAGDIITYSTDAENAATPVSGRVSAFRHKTLNYVYIGEGGLVASNNVTGAQDAYNYYYPVAAPSPEFKPVPRTNMLDSYTVYNLHFYANFLAWAFKQAETNGYNTK